MGSAQSHHTPAAALLRPHYTRMEEHPQSSKPTSLLPESHSSLAKSQGGDDAPPRVVRPETFSDKFYRKVSESCTICCVSCVDSFPNSRQWNTVVVGCLAGLACWIVQSNEHNSSLHVSFPLIFSFRRNPWYPLVALPQPTFWALVLNPSKTGIPFVLKK